MSHRSEDWTTTTTSAHAETPPTTSANHAAGEPGCAAAAREARPRARPARARHCAGDGVRPTDARRRPTVCPAASAVRVGDAADAGAGCGTATRERTNAGTGDREPEVDLPAGTGSEPPGVASRTTRTGGALRPAGVSRPAEIRAGGRPAPVGIAARDTPAARSGARTCRAGAPLAIRLVLAVAVALGVAFPAHAGSWTVYQDDQSGFTAALTSSPSSTIVDSGGSFAADPASGLASSVTRTGTVAGGTYTFTVYDSNFSTAPSGTVSPGSAGGDVASTSQLTVEQPAAQGSATGSGTFGYDSAGSSDSTASRNALLVDFTTTPGGLGLGHFALDLIDFEASLGGVSGLLRLYDGGTLVFSHGFAFAGTNAGNNEVHFLGVVAGDFASYFDQVVLVIGDDTAGGTGNSESWAADRFQFGGASGAAAPPSIVAPTPEPGTWALFGAGAAALCGAVVRRRRARVPPAATAAGGSD